MKEYIGRTIIVQNKEWKWASCLEISSNEEKTFFAECCVLSHEEWLKKGYKEISDELALKLIGYTENDVTYYLSPSNEKIYNNWRKAEKGVK